MDSDLRPAATMLDAQSAVSWAAIAAGAVAAAALALVLIAFGAGLGLSAISPWSDSGVSASTFETGTGIYLVIVGVMASAVGGYLAARLRTKWTGIHTNEVFFRDTAHGFLAWAFATLLSATALAPATAYLANGTSAGFGAVAQMSRSNPMDIYADRLFRSDGASQPASSATNPGAAPTATAAAPNAAGTPNNANQGQARAEVLRLWAASFHDNQGLSGSDKTYLTHLVAARTGLSEADAQKRVDDVTTEAKVAADNARKGAAKLSFWLTAALLFGAFAASLAAVEGGALRDGTWNGRLLTPRAI